MLVRNEAQINYQRVCSVQSMQVTKFWISGGTRDMIPPAMRLQYKLCKCILAQKHWSASNCRLCGSHADVTALFECAYVT